MSIGYFSPGGALVGTAFVGICTCAGGLLTAPLVGGMVIDVEFVGAGELLELLSQPVAASSSNIPLPNIKEYVQFFIFVFLSQVPLPQMSPEGLAKDMPA